MLSAKCLLVPLSPCPCTCPLASQPLLPLAAPRGWGWGWASRKPSPPEEAAGLLADSKLGLLAKEPPFSQFLGHFS